MKFSPKQALTLLNGSIKPFAEVFQHGSLNAEIYKPVEKDYQSPHDRDEIYVIVSGNGTFSRGDELYDFEPGDFLFVPAGEEHRFETFTDDFVTWVFFYGPDGGEG